ncbi:MAG: hypothetical protein PVS3B3_38870 [Ktedonobacteraceae bacterium]
MDVSKVTDETRIDRSWRLGGPMSATQRKEAKSLFIEALKQVHCVTMACEHAEISRKTAYEWREKDADFADLWENAVERSRDIARASIYQRGILGWDEPIISMGQVVYDYEPVLNEDGEPMSDKKGKPVMRRGSIQTIHKWSDTLALGYAKANLPEYKEKQQIDLTAQITTMAETAKDELLADLAAAIANEDKKQSSQE